MTADGIVAVVNNATRFQMFLDEVNDVLAVFIVDPTPNTMQADAVAHGQIDAGIQLGKTVIGQFYVCVRGLSQGLCMGNMAGVEVIANIATALTGCMDVDADALAKAQFHVYIVIGAG